jgi:hypothetical protein
MGKPNYITNLENRMDTLEVSVSDIKDDQDKILIRTGEIHTALMGTEYDRANPGNSTGGGFTKRLTVVEKCVHDIKAWKIRVTTRDKIIWIFLGVAVSAIITSVIKGWVKIFGS